MPNASPPRTSARLALALLAAAAALATARCKGGDDGPRPNVLLLVMDTTRADRCSVTGYSRPTTPCLVEFAKDAVNFRQAWSPANWTGPAHASLFTGLRVDHHGFQTDARPMLRDDCPVIAERFAEAGYATACFTNNQFISPEFGLVRGFQKFEPDYRETQRPAPWSRDTHERAAKWAEEQHAAGKPFFLFINDIEPHLPYEPPLEDATKLLRQNASWDDIRDARAFSARDALEYNTGTLQLAPGKLAMLSDLYDGEIATLDREIGALLDRFRKGGLLDKTVVVVVGDHGELIGERRLIGHGVSVHPAVLHVPLVVRFPGKFEGGKTVDDVVRLEDVAPTLIELCRLKGFDEIDGKSLTEKLSGRFAWAVQPSKLWIDPALGDVHDHGGGQPPVGAESLFDGRRHLVAIANGTNELYDPRNDPGELENLASREPAELERMLKLREAER